MVQLELVPVYHLELVALQVGLLQPEQVYWFAPGLVVGSSLFWKTFSSRSSKNDAWWIR